MKEIKPIYKRLLLLTIVFYVVGVCALQADLQTRIGNIEHAMSHAGTGKCH